MAQLPAKAGDPGSIPGSGRSPGEGNSFPTPVILAWRIPRTEAPGGLWGHKESDIAEGLTFSESHLHGDRK